MIETVEESHTHTHTYIYIYIFKKIQFKLPAYVSFCPRLSVR